MKVVFGLAAGSLAVVLSACGGGGGGMPDSGGCVGTFGGASQVNSSCTNCSTLNIDNAADGDGDSFMRIDLSSPSSQVVVDAKAQDGMVFPAGNRAGALMRWPKGEDTSTSVSGVDFQTFLDGVPQESFEGDGTAVGNPDGGAGFYGQEATLPFDEVQATISFQGTSTLTVLIYEFCGE